MNISPVIGGQRQLTLNTASLRLVASARACSTGPEASLAASLMREERVKAWLPDRYAAWSCSRAFLARLRPPTAK